MYEVAAAPAALSLYEPAVIEVTREVVGDVRACRAVLRIRVADSSFFAGDAALEQAAEVRGLVEALVAEGLETERDVSLESVYVHVSKGLFSKSSTAIYVLRAKCHDIELLPELLDAICDREQCTLLGVEWDWEEHDARQEWVRECLARATEEAQAVARCLGLMVDGVHKVIITTIDQEPRELTAGGCDGLDEETARSATAYAVSKRKRIAFELAGWEMAPSKRLGVRARVLFTIRPSA